MFRISWKTLFFWIFWKLLKIGFVMAKIFGLFLGKEKLVLLFLQLRRVMMNFNISTLILPPSINVNSLIESISTSVQWWKARNTFRFIHFYAFYITLSIEFWSLLSSFSLSVFHARKSQRAYRRWNFHCGTAEISNLHKFTFGVAQRGNKKKSEEKAFKSAFGTVGRS